MSLQILVVTEDDANLAAMLQILTDAGYHTSRATTFEEGKRLLDTVSPDLLIADERLGDFNGLHLILRGRADSPGMAAIVTSPARTAGLETDARQLGVDYLVKPADAADWLRPVSNALDAKVTRSHLLKIAS
jgi:DNA-binding response OmpR family regulator